MSLKELLEQVKASCASINLNDSKEILASQGSSDAHVIAALDEFRKAFELETKSEGGRAKVTKALILYGCVASSISGEKHTRNYQRWVVVCQASDIEASTAVKIWDWLLKDHGNTGRQVIRDGKKFDVVKRYAKGAMYYALAGIMSRKEDLGFADITAQTATSAKVDISKCDPFPMILCGCALAKGTCEQFGLDENQAVVANELREAMVKQAKQKDSTSAPAKTGFGSAKAKDVIF